MKFTVEAAALRRVADAACAIATNRQIPILGSVHISATDGLILSGTDMDMEISARCQASISVPGALCVDAQSFRSFVASLAPGSQIDAEAKGDRLILRAGRARAQFNMLPPDDFPRFSTEGRLTHEFSLPVPALARAIKRTAWAMETSGARTYLCGAFLDIRKDRMFVTATNGHVLSRVEIDLPEGAVGAPSVIVPAAAVAAIGKLLKGVEACDIAVGESLVRFTLGSISFISKLIDGTYPDTDRVIRQPTEDVARIARKDALETLDRATLAAEMSKDGRRIQIGIDGSTMAISAKDMHGEVRDEVEFAGAAQETRYAFNGLYLRGALNAIDDDGIEIHLGQAVAPTLLRGEGDAPGDAIVVMPQR